MSTLVTGAQHIKMHRLAGELPWHCRYCGVLLACPCTTGEDPTLFWRNSQMDCATIDHVDSKARGGGNDTGNLTVACRGCNCSKGARSWPDEWVPNASTFVRRAQIEVEQGDDLITRGVISVLSDMPSRLPLLALADWAGEHVDRIRPVLHDLVNQERLELRRSTDAELRHEYLFQGVAA